MWKQWIEEGKDVWAIGRVAKNPSRLRQRGGNFQNEEGEATEGDEEVKDTFVKHNIKTEGEGREERERGD